MNTLTRMQRDHLAAEGAALEAGRPFMTHRPKRLDPDAHVKAQRQHKIDQVLDHYINTYSLQCRETAGGPIDTWADVESAQYRQTHGGEGW